MIEGRPADETKTSMPLIKEKWQLFIAEVIVLKAQRIEKNSAPSVRVRVME